MGELTKAPANKSIKQFKIKVMINAQDVRIGNLTVFGNRVCKVSQIEDISFYVMDNDDVSYKNTWADIKPIALSPDILEKCGFEIEKPDRWNRVHKREFDELKSEIFVYKLSADPDGMYCYGFCSPTEQVAINNIYFLHQLQNVVKALSGQELIIKL